MLVVDDERLMRWSLTETLADCGDIVTQAENGDTAVRALRGDTAPDVVLLDYVLPDSRDLSLLATLKRLAPSTHIILMTACCTPELAAEALAQGAHRVISKPFDMDDVAALVHRAARYTLPDERPDHSCRR